MDFIFLVALFLPILVAVFMVKALYTRHRTGNRPVKFWTVIMVLALLWNPFIQSFILEPLDNMRIILRLVTTNSSVSDWMVG